MAQAVTGTQSRSYAALDLILPVEDASEPTFGIKIKKYAVMVLTQTALDAVPAATGIFSKRHAAKHFHQSAYSAKHALELKYGIKSNRHVALSIIKNAKTVLA